MRKQGDKTRVVQGTKNAYNDLTTIVPYIFHSICTFYYTALVRISMSGFFQLRNEANLHIYYNADDSVMQL